MIYLAGCRHCGMSFTVDMMVPGLRSYTCECGCVTIEIDPPCSTVRQIIKGSLFILPPIGVHEHESEGRAQDTLP